MNERYNCTMQDMLRKSVKEMPKTYAKTEQAVWVASSLLRWYDEHGYKYSSDEVLAQAVMYIGNGHWPEHRTGKRVRGEW